MELDPLSAIAKEFDCEKFTLCDFTKYYHDLFKDFRNDKFNLFEIGIYKGASMRMWEKYFPNADVYAIDTDLRHMKHSSAKVHTYYLNQCDKDRLSELMDYIGECRIICDDGSHEAPDMVASLEVLYPHLEEGGYYIVEDILPEAKEQVYRHINTLKHKVLVKAQARYRPEVDLLIIQKCTKI